MYIQVTQELLTEKAMGNLLQYSCLENPRDRGAWQAAVHGVAKSWTQLSDFTFTFHFHALEKEMATHSSVPAWRIPGTAEPGRLPSVGSHRVRQLERLSSSSSRNFYFIFFLFLNFTILYQFCHVQVATRLFNRKWMNVTPCLLLETKACVNS